MVNQPDVICPKCHNPCGGLLVKENICMDCFYKRLDDEALARAKEYTKKHVASKKGKNVASELYNDKEPDIPQLPERKDIDG